MKRYTTPVVCLLLLLFALPVSVFAQVSEWEPDVEMDKQVFPVYILTSAEWELSDTDTLEADGKPYYRIHEDPSEQLSADLVLDQAATIKLELLPTSINAYSVYEGELEPGAYGIYPKINFNFNALRQQVQPTPINFTWVLWVNGKKVGQKTITARLRAISDCPFAMQGSSETPERMNYMYAAYVNEDAPQVDDILKEALQTGIVESFAGYQGDEQAVVNQVLAIWTALAHRGIKYSSITTNSGGGNDLIYSQRMRSFSDVLRTNQANCVDGSVLFCSLLRAIDIKPFLCLVPGHCYMGFYLDEAKTRTTFLETTMIGYADISQSKINDPAGVAKTRTIFNQAIEQGTDTFNKGRSQFQKEDSGYELIDIEAARAYVKPIGR